MARHRPEAEPRPEGGELNAAISEAVVHVTRERTGRGPTKARTTIDRDLVVVVLQDSLSSGERYLRERDHAEQVLATRRAFQSAMRDEYVHAVEGLTDRTVSAFMSANHLEPDQATEIFVLEPQRADSG
jgi:uncharacterized protein YbcI